jgi:hypothetical protein
MTQFKLGSISTGTLRTEALLQRFADTLKACGSTSNEIDNAYDFVNAIETEDNPDGNPDAQLIMDLLWEALEAMCPPFIYFGALEGDGADFGFWVDNVAVDDAITTASENEEGDAYITEDGLLAHDGHDVTYMDMERNIVWSTV